MTRQAKQGYTCDPRMVNKPYKVCLSVNGSPKYIGHFSTPQEAMDAYKEARIKYPMLANKRPNPNPKGYSQAKVRCIFCGERKSVHHMDRHVRSCKYADVDRI
jgi:hypothetical protein